MVFLPWAPIQQTDKKVAVAAAAERHGVTEHQIVLAWLLALLAGDPADSGHRLARARRGEHRRRGHRAEPGRDRGHQQGAR